MLIVTFFIFFIFGALALSMVFLSQAHLRLSGFRKASSQIGLSSENGVKEAFHGFMKALAEAVPALVISEEKYEALKEQTKKAAPLIVEETLGVDFPVEIQASEGVMFWQSRTDCALKKMEDREDFFSADFRLVFSSEGGLKSLPQRRSSELEAQVGYIAGHVPLALIPLLINKSLSQEEKENFKEKNNITLTLAAGNLVPAQVSFVEEPSIPQEAVGLLSKALNIKIFQPQDLSNAKLRSALGLEISDDPVPEGVYLIRNDLGLGGIYIRGDVEEMVTAIEEDYQVVCFRLAAGRWVLKFSPSKSQTYFTTPQEVQSYDLIPLGIVIVAGQIKSLGGGIVDSEGSAILVKDREIPSILRGVSLTLVASDKITISSHLLRQGVTWRDGVPYVKEEQAQFIIFSTGQDFQQEEARDGGIVIAEDSPSDLKIQASLAAQGKGFEILGKDKDVRLLGGLQTTNYAAGNNHLSLTSLPIAPDMMGGAIDSPRSRTPLLFLSFLKTLSWKEV